MAALSPFPLSPMHLHPRERDKLLLHQVELVSDCLKCPLIQFKAGFLAQKRLARGLRLNQTEAIALIASQLQERIRDGRNSVAELMQHGKALLGRRQVLPSVPALLHSIQVEGSFHDGSALIVIVSVLLC
jgi:urease